MFGAQAAHFSAKASSISGREGEAPGATRFDSSGRLILEAKDHIKERLTFSPDLGDAAALTFAVDLSARQIADWSPPPYSGAGWMAN